MKINDVKKFVRRNGSMIGIIVLSIFAILLLTRYKETFGNRRQYNLQYPLHEAVEHYNMDKIRSLIDAGMDVNTEDRYGETPLFLVISKRNQDRALLFDIVQLLIHAGANVNAKNSEGETPLFYVESIKLALLLIYAGANINAKDMYGTTVLDFVEGSSKLADNKVLKKEFKEIARLLVKKGAKHGDFAAFYFLIQIILLVVREHFVPVDERLL